MRGGRDQHMRGGRDQHMRGTRVGGASTCRGRGWEGPHQLNDARRDGQDVVLVCARHPRSRRVMRFMSDTQSASFSPPAHTCHVARCSGEANIEPAWQLHLVDTEARLPVRRAQRVKLDLGHRSEMGGPLVRQRRGWGWG